MRILQYPGNGGVHLLLGGTCRFESHRLGSQIDLRRFRKHVDLVESLHDVGAHGADAVLLPHHHVVFPKLFDGGLGQLGGTRHLVRYDAQPLGTEGPRLGDHRPQEVRQHVLGEECRVVGHGHEVDRVGVDGGGVAVARGDHLVVHRQMRSQLGGGLHGVVGDDFVRRAVVKDADHRAVFHRSPRQVAHAAVGALAEEIAPFEVEQRHAERNRIADRGHRTDLVVGIGRDVDRDVAAVAFGPAFLPEVAGDFGDFGHPLGQFGTVFED